MPRLGLALCLCGLAWAAGAQDELDSALEGFDDEAELETPSRPQSDPPEPFWDLTGTLTLGSSIGFAQSAPGPGQPDYRGITRLKAELNLQLDLELPGGWQGRIAGRGFRDYAYALRGRSDYTDAVLEQHQRELEFQEFWLRGSLRRDLDLKFGRQIVVWGRSDSLRIVDVLNPLDNREPGLVDIEDLRLPLVMTRLDYFRGPWTLTGIAIHESRFDELPAFGSDFYPLPFPPPREERPANGGSASEYALALSGVFSGWDLSLHWARYFDDRPHLTALAPFPRTGHARLNLLGASGNLARGNWLWKLEGARFSGLRFFSRASEHVRTDLMLGVEYTGFRETVIALEIANRHLHRWDRALAAAPDFTQRNSLETALRYTADFRHDTIHLIALALVFGSHAEDGSVLRFQVDYDLRDALRLGIGVLLFNDAGGDRPAIDTIEHNDRIFLQARYSF